MDTRSDSRWSGLCLREDQAAAAVVSSVQQITCRISSGSTVGSVNSSWELANRRSMELDK